MSVFRLATRTLLKLEFTVYAGLTIFNHLTVPDFVEKMKKMKIGIMPQLGLDVGGNFDIHTSHNMTKPTKWLCAHRRLRSAWASAQSDQSLRCPHEENLGS